MRKPSTNIVEHAHSGMRMPEDRARRIDELSKGLPADFHYRRMAKLPTEFALGNLPDGSRTDISMVTTDALDRDGEVVLHKGMDLTEFRANPVVVFAHRYEELPLGTAIWITPKDNGLMACTKYARKPEGWTDAWLPDAVLSMMQEGMCRAKSVGFLPLSMRSPTKDEVNRRPELKDCQRVIDKSTMIEFSVVAVPANAEALSMAVSKMHGGKRLAELFAKSIESPTKTLVSLSGVKAMSEHEYATTHVPVSDEAAAKMKAMRDAIPDADLHDDGREEDPHVTLLYGLHDDGPEGVGKLLAGEPHAKMTCGPTAVFAGKEEGDADVLHVAIHSPDLHRMRDRLTKAMPHTNTNGAYVPHATLAYLKKGMGAKYAGDTSLNGHEMTADHVVFSGKDDKRSKVPLAADNEPETKAMGAAENNNADGGYVVPEEASLEAVPMHVHHECYGKCMKAIQDDQATDDDLPDGERGDDEDHLGVDGAGEYHHKVMHEGKVHTMALQQTAMLQGPRHAKVAKAAGELQEMMTTARTKALAEEARRKAVVSLNAGAEARAMALVKAGKINDGAWAPPPDAKEDDYIGIAKAMTAPADRLKYPIVMGGEVYRRGVAAAESRAAAQGAKDVAAAAKRIMDAIKARDVKIAKGFVRPETVKAAVERRQREEQERLAKAIQEEVVDALYAKMGRV